MKFRQQKHFGKKPPSQMSRTTQMISMLACTTKPETFTVESLQRMYGGDAKTAEYHLTLALQRAAKNG